MESNTPTFMAAPAVICVAPNGARRTRADHPALPLTPSEIAREAAACAGAGASVIHLHVRDNAGRHCLDTQRYRDAIAAIHEAVGERLLVQVTTEAVGQYTAQQQMALLRELRPQAASVALRELVPDDSGLLEASRFFAWARSEHIALQFIVYDAREARRLRALVDGGVLPQRTPATLFVLGRYSAGQQSEPLELLDFLREWPRDWPWSVCAFGAREAATMAVAVGLGGHARVGFENNLLRPDGQLAAGNADLVGNVRSLIAGAGRPLADAEQARRVYGGLDA
jgi:3-keto-5-aminohexanoate cleavage enzyme